MTLQGRFKRCMEQMRAEPFGYNSEEWNNLEYYLSYISNGLPLKSSVFRKKKPGDMRPAFRDARF